MVHINIARKMNTLSPTGLDISIAGTPVQSFCKSLTTGRKYTSIFSAVGDFGRGIKTTRDMKNFLVNNHWGKL